MSNDLERHCSRCQCMTGPDHHMGCGNDHEYFHDESCPGGWKGFASLVVDWPEDLPSWEDIRDAFRKECPDGFFEMQMVEDFDIIEAVYAQGIDSRLEAITEPSTNEWVPNPPFGNRLKLRLTCKSLLVFLRRLWEMTYDEGALEDEESPGSRAERLVRDVLGTLGFEDV